MAFVYKIFVKSFALFSVVRAYNMLFLTIAQYLAALFIFSRNKSHLETLLDPKLAGIVVASALSVSAGFIINNFYDLERDRISKPLEFYVQRFISQEFKLRIYLLINALALVIAALVSWRVFVFFFAYQFMVWYYSHYLNKVLLLNNLTYIVLKIVPFFALFIYYQNFTLILVLLAIYLGILLLISDIIKDFISMPADAVYKYQTLPIEWGKKATRHVIIGLSILGLLISIYLLWAYPLQRVYFYFILTDLFYLFLIFRFARPMRRTTFKILHWLIRFLIVIGVLSMVLLEFDPLTVIDYIDSK